MILILRSRSQACLHRRPGRGGALDLAALHKSKTASFQVEGGETGTIITKSDGPASATIETTFDTLLPIIWLNLPLEQAIKKGAFAFREDLVVFEWIASYPSA